MTGARFMWNVIPWIICAYVVVVLVVGILLTIESFRDRKKHDWRMWE